MNLAVVGAGYVGLSLAVLLSQKHNVVLLDIVQETIDRINSKHSPIKDHEIEDFFQNKELKLTATLNPQVAYENADFIIIALPTDYEEGINSFNTTSIEQVIGEAIQFSPNATIVIKSTIPIGFTDSIIEKTKHKNILFAPEFLREGKALYDNLYPSRIVIGYRDEDERGIAQTFANLLLENTLKPNIDTLFTGTQEAESIKLFSNTYLALRVAFFNELDTFAQIKKLNTKQIIDGVCLDSRIGNYYNNPSFGYGGYCLPKDSKQLLAHYNGVPNSVIQATVEANIARKQFVMMEIAKTECSIIGVYRLVMKSGSDNFRQSSILDIIKYLVAAGKKVIIFEPELSTRNFLDCEVIPTLDEFKRLSDLIIANRYDKQIRDCREKVYTRDLFFRD